MKERAQSRIRPARPGEAAALRALTLRAKAHWGDPPEDLAAWADALDMDEAFLARSATWVAEGPDDALQGYYSLLYEAQPVDGDRPADPAWWLDNLFVEPACMGGGLGAALYRHAAAEVRKRGENQLFLLSDAHAAGFYAHMGAELVGRRPSIVPAIVLPVYRHSLDTGGPAHE